MTKSVAAFVGPALFCACATSSPVRPEVKEICVPFGLHSGVDSIEESCVSRRRLVPSSFTT